MGYGQPGVEVEEPGGAIREMQSPHCLQPRMVLSMVGMEELVDLELNLPPCPPVPPVLGAEHIPGGCCHVPGLWAR